MTSCQSPTKTRKTKSIATLRGTRSIQLDPLGPDRVVGEVALGDVAHRKASLSSRPADALDQRAEARLVIMSSVRGRGRSIGTASTKRPGRGDMHVDDVGEDHRLRDRVGDEEGGGVASHADALQLHVHEVAAELVERAERLVEKQHRRLGDQHPADRRPLRHAAERSPG